MQVSSQIHFPARLTKGKSLQRKQGLHGTAWRKETAWKTYKYLGDIVEMGDVVEWIHLALDRDQWLSLVRPVINRQVP